MKYSAALTSKIILFYLFNCTELLNPENFSTKCIFDDLEEYMSWAQKRIEYLFCECSSLEISTVNKIKKIDEKLVAIFPFLIRIVDRSYIIQKALAYLELYEKDESQPTPVSAPQEPIIAPSIAPSEPEPEVEKPPVSVEFIEPTTNIDIKMSLHKLRTALNILGIKNAFLLTKREAVEKACLYNAGKLSIRELKK